MYIGLRAGCTVVRLAEGRRGVPSPGGDLGQEGDDDEEDEGVEEEVGDGDPVLQRAPVVGDEHPDVLGAGEQGGDQPGEDEAGAAGVAAEDQQQRAHHAEQGVKHGVLDEGTCRFYFYLDS